MPHYIAVIHKEPDSSYGVSFPDLPGVIAAGGTIDQAVQNAAEAVAFAAEDWSSLSREQFPPPRSIDDLRRDTDSQESVQGAVIAAVPLRAAFAPAG